MWKKITLTVCAAALLAGSLAGCGNSADSLTYDEQGRPIVTIMTQSFSAESASDDASKNPVIKEVEDKIGADLRIKWISSSNYGEKVTATMAAGTYPLIMRISDRSSAIIANCRHDTFWEVGDLMLDESKFPNLSKANKDVMHNMSVDGKVYGVYSARDLGRNGVSIRKDWLDNLGLDYPETVEEFKEVCRAFTEDDPDGNGQKDTYGLIMTSYTTPIKDICVWAGAPNGYGFNEETGELEPAFYFDEYLEGLKVVKWLYDNQYMNTNWATMDSNDWNNPFLNGQGGIIIDVCDRARRLATNIAPKDPNAVVGVFGAVAPKEGEEKRSRPTTGYNGFFAFPKDAVKTEEELEVCLGILDKIEAPEVADLLAYGIEGRQYQIVNGEYQKFKNDKGEDDKTHDGEFADLNQIQPFINPVSSNLKIPYATETAKWVDEVMADNAKYSVSDPSAPYISNTYALKGTSLDSIMSEADTKFIKGDFTEEQWKAAREEWKAKGGDDIVKEYNEAYQQELEAIGSEE
ncbi:MAG: extracellular solute-binding protein [Clostridiales bacterium]|nr:extracellular solute-binding protein [Clostridiales bacterium]